MDFNSSQYASEPCQDRYFICEAVISDSEVERLRSAVAKIPRGEEVRRKRNVYGVRNLLEVCPAVARLASEAPIRGFVTPVLGDHAFAVRAIFFDKVQG